jgi:hypothetical protein
MLSFSEQEENVLRADAVADQIQSFLKETLNTAENMAASAVAKVIDALNGKSPVEFDSEEQTFILNLAIYGLASVVGRPLVNGT